MRQRGSWQCCQWEDGCKKSHLMSRNIVSNGTIVIEFMSWAATNISCLKIGKKYIRCQTLWRSSLRISFRNGFFQSLVATKKRFHGNSETRLGNQIKQNLQVWKKEIKYDKVVQSEQTWKGMAKRGQKHRLRPSNWPLLASQRLNAANSCHPKEWRRKSCIFKKLRKLKMFLNDSACSFRIWIFERISRAKLKQEASQTIQDWNEPKRFVRSPLSRFRVSFSWTPNFCETPRALALFVSASSRTLLLSLSSKPP